MNKIILVLFGMMVLNGCVSPSDITLQKNSNNCLEVFYKNNKDVGIKSEISRPYIYEQRYFQTPQYTETSIQFYW
jgi:hypothetical protein